MENLQKIKDILEKEKVLITEELKKFATEDKNIKGDWDTKFPFSGVSESGGSALERAADEVEEYGNRLPIEFNLENKLKNINLALNKIKRGTYGVCENCGRAIPEERLAIYPEARFCLQCGKTKIVEK